MNRLRKLRGILPAVLALMLSFPLAVPVLADQPGGGPMPSTIRSGHSTLNPPPSTLIVELREGGSIERVNARFGTTTIGQMSAGRVYLLAPPANISPAQMAKSLEGDPDVLYAELNQAFKSLEAQQFSLAFDGQHSFAVPDDEAQAIYQGQWAVYKTRLPEAQDIAAGIGTIVAIVDTGVALSHPALSSKFTQGRYDFVDGDDDPSDSPNGLDDDGDGFVDEATGHGTFLAGIVALVAPEASIMPLRVLNSDGWGTSFDVAAAIRYAVDNGANVINVSLGVSRGSRVLESAVDHAYARNVVLVASVGNRSPEDRTGNILYPARYAKAVAVAATDSDDMKASFSNWGNETDLAAPGTAIYSTYWNGGFAWWSGTSMAAAFVSGGAALLKGANPNWTTNDVVSRLTGTAVDIDKLNYKQYRGKLGAGRVDFYAALD